MEPDPEIAESEPEIAGTASSGGLLKELFAAAVLAVFLLGLLISVAPRLLTTSGETYYLGLVGPMSGTDAKQGKAMVAGARLLIERANASGELGEKHIELIIRDDKNDPETARKQALSLAQETDVLAVLGHLTDEVSSGASAIYKKHELPVVSGSGGVAAVTVDNKWYFRTGLTTTLQGTFVASYMSRVLNEDRLIIIEEASDHGRSLFLAIEDELSLTRRLGRSAMVIQRKWLFNPDAPDAEAKIKEITDNLSANYAGEMIFLAVREKTAATLIRRIQDNPRMRFGNPIPFKIMGPEALSKPSVIASFSKLRREKNNPGVYSEGVYAVASFLEDVANQEALDFREQYKARHGGAPSLTAAGFHDAAAVVVDALRRLETSPYDLKAARNEIRGHLAGLDSPDKAVPGVTGDLRFDGDGNAVKPVPVGIYHARQLVSPPLQLSPFDLDKSSDEQDVLQIGGNYFIRTNIVHAGLQVNQISDIDLSSQRFKADFNLWFRYHSKLDLSAIEFPNAAEQIKLGKPIEESIRDGAYYRLYRVKGLFKTDFITASGPSRNRLLGIQVRHRKLNLERLILVPDVLGMESGKAGNLKERIGQKIIFGKVIDWAVAKAQTYLDTEPIATLGNPRFGGKKVEGYSRFNLGIWIEPTEVTLRGLIDPKIALRLLLLLGIAISLLTIGAGRTRLQPIVNLFWFPKALAFLLMLFCAEAVAIDWLTRRHGSTEHIEIAITSFRVLWWFAPAWLFIRGVERFGWTPLEQRTGRDIPPLVRLTFAGLIYTLAMLGVIAFVFDQKVTSLLATSGVLAMIFGLALQMNLSNIFSGIAINMERPFRMGDWIKVADFEPGKVVGITWRTTRMETMDKNIICIPNSVASDSSVENLSYPEETYRSELMVHVDPGAKPQWVEKILFDAVISGIGVLKEPRPMVVFQGVKDWSAGYAVRFFCEDYEASIEVEAAVWRGIVRNLRYGGFKSVIHEEFTLFHLDEDATEERDDAALLIADVEVFEPFQPHEKERICDMLRRYQLEPERTVIHQGDEGNSLFIVAEGALVVEITMDDGEMLEVGRLGAGDFFGEMALLTGEPRGATVSTITPSQVFEITKDDFALVIKEFPEITEDLSKVLTRRTLENLRKKDAHYASVTEEQSLARAILSKIGRFFDISMGGNTASATKTAVRN